MLYCQILTLVSNLVKYMCTFADDTENLLSTTVGKSLNKCVVEDSILNTSYTQSL
jgi:hypothetical protein